MLLRYGDTENRAQQDEYRRSKDKNSERMLRFYHSAEQKKYPADEAEQNRGLSIVCNITVKNSKFAALCQSQPEADDEKQDA